MYAAGQAESCAALRVGCATRPAAPIATRLADGSTLMDQNAEWRVLEAGPIAGAQKAAHYEIAGAGGVTTQPGDTQPWLVRDDAVSRGAARSRSAKSRRSANSATSLRSA